MNVIIAILIISFVFGSSIFNLFSTKQGYTHYDIYRQKMYGIEPNRENDADETVSFDENSTLYNDNEQL